MCVPHPQWATSGLGGGGQQESGQVVDMKDSVKTEEVLDQVFKGVVGDKEEVVVDSRS